MLFSSYVYSCLRAFGIQKGCNPKIGSKPMVVELEIYSKLAVDGSSDEY